MQYHVIPCNTGYYDNMIDQYDEAYHCHCLHFLFHSLRRPGCPVRHWLRWLRKCCWWYYGGNGVDGGEVCRGALIIDHTAACREPPRDSSWKSQFRQGLGIPGGKCFGFALFLSLSLKHQYFGIWIVNQTDRTAWAGSWGVRPAKKTLDFY